MTDGYYYYYKKLINILVDGKAEYEIVNSI
jgi:hypothetical protein